MTAFLLALFSSSPQTPRITLSRLIPAARAWARAAIFLGAGTFTWLALLCFPVEVAGPKLDPSWAQSLAYFLKHRFQAGQQYIFTYGPLGYFATPMYDSDLFWVKIAWEILLKFILVFVLLRLTRHTLSFIPRLLFCLLAAVFLFYNPDGSYAFFLFLVGASLASANEFSRGRLLAGTFLLATIALVKFTLLVEALLMVALVAGRLLCQRPRARALLPPAFFGTFLVSWWLVLGQSLANIPRYLYNSLQIATGYVEAMMVQGEKVNIYLAFAILALLGAALLSRSFFEPRNLLTTGVVVLFLFLQWKHGFVRQDMHQVFFFTMPLLCPFLFPALFPSYRWRGGPRPVLIAVAVCLSAAEFVHVFTTEIDTEPKAFLSSRVVGIINQAKLVPHLGALKVRLERHKEEMARQFALPQIAARVQDASVDTFTCEQGVLLLNRFNWTPRPIFQGYSAYTSYLQSVNAQFLASKSAPKYLIFRLEGFDGKAPAQEDGQTLLEIFEHYHPVLTEKFELLLERNPTSADGPPPEWKSVRERVIRFDEELSVEDLPDVIHLAKIHLTYSWAGLVRKALYKPPLVFLKLRTEDHQVFTYRLIPATASSGFLLNPLLQETWDMVDLYGTEKGKRVVALCVSADEQTRKSFTNRIHVTIDSTACLVAEKLEAKEQKRLRYPMMKTPPDEVFSSLRVPVDDAYEGRQVLLLHPEGMMRFQVGAGERRVRGQFGILPMAYEKGSTDGVWFTIEFLPDQGGPPAVLWERSLDPRNQPTDRGIHELDLKVPASAEGQLIFRTSARPGKTVDWSWSFWTGIEIN